MLRYYKLTKQNLFPSNDSESEATVLAYGQTGRGKTYTMVRCGLVWWGRFSDHFGLRLIFCKITGSTHHCLGFVSSVSKSKLNKFWVGTILVHFDKTK